jgi:hypothetical protein
VSAQQGKIQYSDIKERNIFDTRFTGCGKTTSALEYIAGVVKEKRPVIVLMQSYERLENNYYRPLDDAKVRSITFKGKTQEGLCIHAKDYRKLWGAGTPPKNECKGCPDSTKCGYQKQLADLTKFSKSNEGFCVLTTEKNFKKVYSEIKDRNPVLIIDDIPLSSVIMPESEITDFELESLVHHLHKQGSRVQNLHELALMLKDYTPEKEIEISNFIILNEGDLFRELNQFLTDNTGTSALPSHKGLAFLSRLIRAVKTNGSLHFYSDFNRLKIVSDESSKFNSMRICYLNATPSIIDEYCIEQLGDYKPLNKKVEKSKRYVVFQITDSATTKQAILTSKRMRGDVQEITKVIKPTLFATGQKLLVFGHDDVLKEWGKHDVFSGVETASEIYFGSNTRGTNDYKDYPISILLGTPYYPQEYFLHPAFEPHWKTKAQIEKERKEKPNGFLSYVPCKISNQEARTNLLQMIGRNLRDNPDNPNAVKVVIVFTSIDIRKDCKEQNGGTVIPTLIRPDMSVKKGKRNGDTPFFDNFKKVGQKALKPQIIKFIVAYIDRILKENPDEPLSLHVVATALHDRISIYDVAGIKSIISKLYDTESRYVNNTGKQVKTAFIIKKKPL